jgi:hypothetical protein
MLSMALCATPAVARQQFLPSARNDVSNDTPTVTQLTLVPRDGADGVRAWEVRVAFDGAPPADATLEVFDRDPDGNGVSLCRPPILPTTFDRCIVDAARVRDGTAWVRVTADSGDARTRMSYRLYTQPLRGIQLEGTNLFTDYARPSLTAPAVVDAADGSRVIEHVYTFSGGRREMIAADAASDAAVLSLSLYNERGNLLSSTYRPARQQALLVPSGTASRYLLVRWEGAQPTDATQAYMLRTLGDSGNSEQIDAQLARGYAFRMLLPSAQYQALLGLADQMETTGRSTLTPDAFALISAIIRGSVSEQAGPIVAFIGVGGHSQIVQFRHDAGRLLAPSITTLGNARDFWAIYVEDDQSPFETSIDVEFRQRAPQSDFEAFNPLGAAKVLSPSDAGTSARNVRVGIRQFRIRQPPVAVQVAFTRQGPTYGLRQWHRVFRVLGWERVGFALGVFIPATEITVSRHAVEQRDCEAINCRSGEDGLVTQQFYHRQVFAAAMFQWHGARSRFIDAISRWEKVKALWPPNLVIGFGLPPRRQSIYYVGMSWPLAWERLQATVGSQFGKRELIVAPYTVGTRLPFGTPDAVLSRPDWDFKPTFGVSIDLFRQQ